MKMYILCILALCTVHCKSPMDNRLDEPESFAQKANILELSSLKLSLKTQWLEGPVGNLQVNNTLLVSVYNSNDELTDLPDSLQLQFYATMPSMGHPMDDAGMFERISTGLYLNSTIKYNMQGDWQNELWLMDQNYQTVEAVQWFDSF